MRDDNTLQQNVVAAQKRMFRLAERDYGLTRKVLHLETGIGMSTLASYVKKDATATMSIVAFVKLCRVIPDELTSLCLEPAARFVGTDIEGDGDLDALEVEASGVVHEIAKAKRDKVVTTQERGLIRDCTRRMMPSARAVAA